MIAELAAPRYIARFRCLGGDCPDDCCHGWRVVVDRKHYEALRARMASPEERAELERGMTPIAGGDAQRHALTVLGNRGRCSFLDGAGWCTIHARYGEEALPDGCSSFPRSVGRVGARIELAGHLSCPEVARLALLADDGLEMAPAERALFGRGQVHHLATGDDPYARAFAPVRALLLDLLGLPGYPTASRLFFVAYFADRARPWLRKDGAPLDPDALESLLAAARRPEVHRQLHEDFSPVGADPSYPLSIACAILALPEHAQPEGLLRLGDEVRRVWAAAGAPLDGDLEALGRAWRERPQLPAAPAARLDELLARYARHYVMREWYVNWPSLLGYVHGLFFRVAVLRFIVVSLWPAEDLDALVVRAAYSLTRLLEHDKKLGTSMLEEVERKHLTELEWAAALLKL